LEGEGADVITMQRRPRFTGVDAHIEYDRWCEGDLEEPSNTIKNVAKLVKSGKQLDGVIHAALCSDELESDMVNSFDMQNAFQINVIEPLMLMQYLLEYKVLRWSGKAIFFTDLRCSINTHKPRVVSKACVAAATTAFAADWPTEFQYMFLRPPEEARMGATDVVSDTVLRLLNGRITFPNRQEMGVVV
jgi:short-subunit dehydrogenase